MKQRRSRFIKPLSPIEKSIRGYAEFASKLLLNGYPFEIMDGDRAMVPLVWVKAVFAQLQRHIGKQKLLAISVLGIQSSGKSTLLNAMFGLKFPVSSGRCTRGVFIQLVQIAKGILPFSYVLVIDTEGLRAPELSDQNYEHDNELATFVLGLGNITIINIKGENTSEIENVLQIAVHAFLRLKMANGKLDLQQTCIFTHQNVPAVDASTAMTHGRQKMMDKLDKMTYEVASQEGLADITSFNQVIKVDPQNHMWYFSDLYFGNPPMAPINIGYSEKVSEVKHHILFDIAEKKKTFLTVAETISRIEDLWKGILSDDFVFSFRNSLEMKAYNMMESKFQKLTWTLDTAMSDFIQKIARTTLVRCKDEKELERLSMNLQPELHRTLSEGQSYCQEQWNNFVESCSLREYMEQWKQNRDIRLIEYVHNLEIKGQRHIQRLKKNYALELVQAVKRYRIEKEIKKRAIQLAAEYRTKARTRLSLDLQKSAFDKMWEGCVGEFKNGDIQDEGPIEKQVRDILFEQFSTDRPLLSRHEILSLGTFTKLEDSFAPSMLEGEDISSEQDKVITRSLAYRAISVINVIFKSIDSHLSEVSFQDSPFDKTNVKTVYMKLIESFRSHNEGFGEHCNFKLTNALKVKLAVHITKHINKVFFQLDQRYQLNHSMQAQMAGYKQLVWRQFSDTVANEQDGVILTNMLINKVINLVCQEMEKRLPIEVERIVILKYIPTKRKMMIEIMTDLAKRGEFKRFYWYIIDGESFVRDWVKESTNNLVFGPENTKKVYQPIIKSMTEEYLSIVIDSLDHAEIAMEKQRRPSISHWAEMFERFLGQHLPVPNHTFTFVEEFEVENYDFVCAQFKKREHDIGRQIQKRFVVDSNNKLLWKGRNPYASIFDRLSGCKERCPFCREACQNTAAIHPGEDHCCIQHRPPGLKGVHKEVDGTISWENCNYKVWSRSFFNCGVSDYKCQDSGNCRASSRDDNVCHRYRDYKIFLPGWEITPSTIENSSTFWKWFIYNFKSDLEKTYGFTVPDIVKKWKSVSKQEAIKSMNKLMLG